MGNDVLLWAVGSEPAPEKEAEYNAWYNQHITDFFEFKDLMKTSRYHCYHQMDAIQESVKYLALYEFETKEALEAFPKSPPFAAATKDWEKNWKWRGKEGFELIWSGLYEPLKSLERKKLSKPIIWIAASRCKPDKEAEYNEWYNQHITEFFEFKDLMKTSRYRCYQQMGENRLECTKYLAFYEFETKEALEAFRQSPIMAAATKDFEEKWPGFGGDIVWCGWYEPIKSLERK